MSSPRTVVVVLLSLSLAHLVLAQQRAAQQNEWDRLIRETTSMEGKALDMRNMKRRIFKPLLKRSGMRSFRFHDAILMRHF